MQRFRAPEALTKEGQARCKVSVMAQSVAHLSETVPYETLQPYGEHFHPERYNLFEEKTFNLERRRAGTPHVAAGFVPMQKPVCWVSYVHPNLIYLHAVFLRCSSSFLVISTTGTMLFESSL